MNYEYIADKNRSIEANKPGKALVHSLLNRITAEHSAEFKNSKMIIADGCEYSLDDYSTKVSNNVLITGSVGCGKTRNIVSANIYMRRWAATYAYLGGNDLDTQKAISERCDRPLSEISAMPIGYCWVFRRGNKPVFAKLKNTDRCIEEMMSVREQERGVG